MRYDLPVSMELGGREYRIDADFRTALEIIAILNDPGLTPREQISLALLFFYPEFGQIPQSDYQQAVEECFRFLSGGERPRPGPVLMSWEQDFPYIIAPVNRVVGKEIRSEPFFHWWSFLGAYREIGDCLFSQIVRIRSLRAAGKRLDPAQEEWYRANRDLVDLKTPITPGEEALLRLWGGPERLEVAHETTSI